ncbi:sulfatase [Lutibacter citreus]|uniref:sulfatase n=1 Tax=Lutibacter citreus TaxID=2138210 RepID=UPI000DBE2133|nr:sulfatase [Lutibacter citreus]
MKLKIRLTGLLLTLLQIIIAQDKPNVVFIAIDDLNDYASCMNGSISVPTPNIDRLAKQGTLFNNAHCQAPICGPSRASIMTGLYPSTTGNYLQLDASNIKKGSVAASKAIYMQDYFEQNGYKTMSVGKIYSGGDETEFFQEFGGCFDRAGPKPPQRMNYDPSVMPNKIGNTMTDWGAFPDYDNLMPDNKSAMWGVNKLNQNHDKPFFLAVGFNRPHVPWHVPKKWFDMFPLEDIKLPPYKKDDMDDIPEMGKRVANVPQMPSTEGLLERGEWKEVIQAYSACVAFVDAQVGLVLDALENSAYANNTVVVLWSDHGYHLGEKNRVAKQALWERDTRSILIFKDVSNNSGKTCNATVELVDVYPTLLDLCKIPVLEQLEGNSLKSLMKNPKKKWKHPALCFYGENNIVVRGDRYRLTQYEDNSLELYDMKKDPNEWYNLAKLEEHQHIIKELQKHIPKEWTPLSKYTGYGINEYFKQKSGWK